MPRAGIQTGAVCDKDVIAAVAIEVRNGHTVPRRFENEILALQAAKGVAARQACACRDISELSHRRFGRQQRQQGKRSDQHCASHERRHYSQRFPALCRKPIQRLSTVVSENRVAFGGGTTTESVNIEVLAASS